MITVACCHAGNYENRGVHYIETLRSMVARNLSEPYRFVVVEGGPHEGWWTKVRLFEPGRFQGRVLYLDLDSVIVGPLDELAATKGIIGLRDWGWDRDVYGSGVMVWDAGEHAEIFARYTDDVPVKFRGDQDWMTSLGGWPTFPPGMVCSYRYHASKAPPEGVAVVAFHGRPKPHELMRGHWALEYWR